MAATAIIRALRPRVASGTAGDSRPWLAAHAPPLALVGAVLCAASVAVAGAGASSDAAFGRGLLQLLIVGVPIAVGLYALRAPGNTGFGIAMLGIGFAWSLTALAESSSSVLHTIGRLATWLTFPCAVYLLLAFPDGRIAKGLDRFLFTALIAVMVFLFFGTAPFVQAFPAKTLWASCTDCPPNALFVLDQQPAVLTKVVLVREWLVELLWLGLFVSMFRRWRAASPLQQRAMGPAFVAGALLGVAHLTHITTRQLGAPADTVIAISSVWTFCIVAVCVAFLFGLLWRRMHLAAALARLGAQRVSDDPAELRDALSAALKDPTMDLLFRGRESGEWGELGAWHDARGRPVSWPLELPRGRAATYIGAEDDDRVAVLIHDVALRDDPELLEGVSGIVHAGWRHGRVLSDLGEAMRDLEDSRRRIAEAADIERARIERDIHDGAQQRLIALRIRLGMAEETLKREPAAGIRDVHELGFEAELALDELRSLAQGIYPSLLTDRGLPDALRAMARHAPMPIHIAADGVTRHPIKVESAVYFTCVEAVQNAMKHAAGATAVWVTLTQSAGALRFEVRDDGAGFPVGARDGRGLRNMRDRVEAIGGNLAFETSRGRGTLVVGSVDLSAE